MSSKTINFLNEACNEAHNSKLLMKHGCVIVKNGKIIGRGHNYHRTKSNDGFLCKNCSSCHAEINAIRQIYHNMGFNGHFMYHLKGKKCKKGK